MVLVVGGSLLAALGVAGAGYLMLSAGGSDTPGGSGVVAAPGQQAAPAPAPASTTSTLPPAPVALQVNARNPFAARVATKGTGGSGSGTAEGTGGSASGSGGGSGGGSEATSVVTAVVTTTYRGAPVTVTTTKTSRDESVWLTLTALDDPTGVEKKSKFIVNGKNYSRFPGETFGQDDRFTYVSNQQDDLGTWCALVSYVDEEYIICPDEQIKVH
jgi:hypothetical protein